MEDEPKDHAKYVRWGPNPWLNVVVIEISFPKVLKPHVVREGGVQSEPHARGQQRQGEAQTQMLTVAARDVQAGVPRGEDDGSDEYVKLGVW